MGREQALISDLNVQVDSELRPTAKAATKHAFLQRETKLHHAVVHDRLEM